MSFCTVSNWTTREWTDEMESLARDKYLPLIMSMGADGVRMIRTGENSFSVVTEYSDAAVAEAAQAKIAAIRAEAADELPMSMDSAHAGPVFAQS